MKLMIAICGFVLVGGLLLSGCVVRSYQVTRDRVDQNLSVGNRGYLMGKAPAGAEKERKATRTTQVIEVELGNPAVVETKPMPAPQMQMPAQIPQLEEYPMEGNRGYITESITPKIAEPEAVSHEKYTVQKNDTLQKISQKFYGTTKRWMKIYDANKDKLKGPDKIYAGQVLRIPVEGLKEPKENLK